MLRALARRLEEERGIPRASLRLFSNSRIPEKPLLVASGLAAYGRNGLASCPAWGPCSSSEAPSSPCLRLSFAPAPPHAQPGISAAPAHGACPRVLSGQSKSRALSIPSAVSRVPPAPPGPLNRASWSCGGPGSMAARTARQLPPQSRRDRNGAPLRRRAGTKRFDSKDSLPGTGPCPERVVSRNSHGHVLGVG